MLIGLHDDLPADARGTALSDRRNRWLFGGRNEVLVFELNRKLTGALAMVTYKEMRVQEIVDDDALSTEQKVKKLREIESDARALQRASSESAMNADDGWEADLRLVRKALDKLGAVEPPKGAASL
jgi:hypothetical protein